MKGKRLLATSLVICLCLCACSSRDVGISESSGSLVPSSSGVYRYYDIPGFPGPNTIPLKITYHKVMLGEKFEITDASQIEQIMELLDEVELDGSSVERDDDDELHQVIDLYADAEDEEPASSLCFLKASMYIETKEGSSDLYQTLNWNNTGTDDESKINLRLGKLIDSWARPESPLLPPEESKGTESNSEEQAPTSSTSSDSLLEAANTEHLPVFGRLINCEDWNAAEEIPVFMYYDWYRDYINSITTHEERIERYKLDSDPDSPGWAYPAEEFEACVQQHFAVSTEYLRGSDEVYLADQEVYWIASGGSNISYRTKVESDEDIQADGEILTMRVACSLLGDFSDTIYKTLVADTSGEHIRFIRCTEEPGQDFKQLEIDVPVIGADMEQSKRLIFFCPPDWESFHGDINRENKKLVDLICTTPDRTEDRLATIDDKKEVVIGERTFQVFSEEYGILENEPQKQVVPYVIWRYYYFDGELYYCFDFYQNQQTMPVTLDEFEAVLATMENHDAVG